MHKDLFTTPPHHQIQMLRDEGQYDDTLPVHV